MKKTFIASLLLISLVSLAQAQSRNTEQAILKLEQEWVTALVKADTAALDKLYAPTLVYTHSSGQVDDKAKYIANIKAGGTKYESIDRDDVKVTAYGDTAIVTCHALIKLTNKSGPATVNARMIHVYAKQGGRWQLVAHQTTKLA